MKKLSNDKKTLRRQFDFSVLQNTRGGPARCTTHFTAEEAESGANPVRNESDAAVAAHYRIVWPYPTLVGPGKSNAPTIVRIDAASAGYPFTEPTAWVVNREGSKTPWSPHFWKGLPVCIGTIWHDDGQVLIAHLAVHIMKLLNWAEQLDPGYEGYNGRAVRWWRDHLGRPLNPEASYPALPLDLLYGAPVVKKVGGFRAVTRVSTGGFRSIGSS